MSDPVNLMHSQLQGIKQVKMTIKMNKNEVKSKMAANYIILLSAVFLKECIPGRVGKGMGSYSF